MKLIFAFQESTINGSEELWIPIPMDTHRKQLPHLSLREATEEGAERLQEPEDPQVYCEAASLLVLSEPHPDSLSNLIA